MDSNPVTDPSTAHTRCVRAALPDVVSTTRTTMFNTRTTTNSLDSRQAYPGLSPVTGRVRPLL